MFYFLCGNSRPVSKSRLCCNSLPDFAHIFCCAGNGIAAEHIVAIVFVVNENCPHVFAAQEKELLLNDSKSSTFGLDYFLNDCLFPTATQLRIKIRWSLASWHLSSVVPSIVPYSTRFLGSGKGTCNLVFGTEISSYLTSKTNATRPNLQSPYLPAPYVV